MSQICNLVSTDTVLKLLLEYEYYHIITFSSVGSQVCDISSEFISVLYWLGGLPCELDISRLDTSCCLHQTRNQTQLRKLLSRSQ